MIVGVGAGVDLEQPTVSILVDVNCGGVIHQLVVKSHQLAIHRRVERAFCFLAFDRTDLLLVLDRHWSLDQPVQEINVLQQANCVGGEPETELLANAGCPHVVGAVLTIGGKLGLEFPHHENQVVAHYV